MTPLYNQTGLLAYRRRRSRVARLGCHYRHLWPGTDWWHGAAWSRVRQRRAAVPEIHHDKLRRPDLPR